MSAKNLILGLLMTATAVLGKSASDPTQKFLGLGGTPTVKGASASTEAVRVFNEIRAKAQGGDSQAQFSLAQYYLYGKSPAIRDEKVAEDWLIKAAKQGNGDALSALYLLHNRLARRPGGGVDSKELAEAYKWRVIKDGVGKTFSPGGLRMLSVSEETQAEATRLAEQFITANPRPSSSPPTGVFGETPPIKNIKSSTPELQDDAVVIYYEVKAKAEAGDPKAQMRMSEYASSPPYHSTIPKDPSGKLGWMLKAAKQDYRPACNALGNYYLVQAKENKNDVNFKAEGIKWYIIEDKLEGKNQKAYTNYSLFSHTSEATMAEAQHRADAYFADREKR